MAADVVADHQRQNAGNEEDEDEEVADDNLGSVGRKTLGFWVPRSSE